MSGDLRLRLEGACRADEVVELACRILERELDVVESRRLEGPGALGREADARREQVAVVAEAAAFGQATDPLIAGLDIVPFGQGAFFDDDTMFREFAVVLSVDAKGESQDLPANGRLGRAGSSF